MTLEEAIALLREIKDWAYVGNGPRSYNREERIYDDGYQSAQEHVYDMLDDIEL